MLGTMRQVLMAIQQDFGKDAKVMFMDRMQDRVVYTIRQLRYNDSLQQHLRNYDRFVISEFLEARCKGYDEGTDYITLRPAYVPGGYTDTNRQSA